METPLLIVIYLQSKGLKNGVQVIIQEATPSYNTLHHPAGNSRAHAPHLFHIQPTRAHLKLHGDQCQQYGKVPQIIHHRLEQNNHKPARQIRINSKNADDLLVKYI